VSEERANAAIARLGQITTEMAARRELRDRAAEAARTAARESTLKIGPVAEKVAAHLAEMGRRQREAGGWATQKTLADKDNLLGFGPEEDETGEFAGYTPPPAAPPRPEGDPADQIGALADDDHHPEPTPQPVASRGGRRRAPEPEDDDDFSATSSWLS
jgi:hypothetical protein